MAVSWPLVKHGTYDAGDVATAANFEGDFNKVFDAVNQLHNRFSTLEITAKYAEYGTGTAFGQASRAYFKLFKVPDWAQALRLRKITVTNTSLMDDGETYTDFNEVSGGPIKVRLATSSAIGNFNKASYSATDVTTLTFSAATHQNEVLGIESALGYPHIEEADITSNNVILPDTYIGLYLLGGVTCSSTTNFVQFDVSVLCDAMVPVP